MASAAAVHPTRRPGPHTRRRARALLLALAVLSSATASCADPKGRYDAFLARTSDQRIAAGDGGPAPSERFDFSGRYLLALKTPIAPATPLLLRVDATVSSDLTKIAFVFQPLATDQAPQPRAAVGSSIQIEGVAYDAQGSFDADLGQVAVPGSANPISGSDITATVQLRGTALHAGGAPLLCGSASGNVTSPIMLNLAGSQFGAVPAQDPAGVELVTGCPEQGADGGS